MTSDQHEQSTHFLRNLLKHGRAVVEWSARWRSVCRMGPLSCSISSNSEALHRSLTRCLLPGGPGRDFAISVLSGSQAPFEEPPGWNLPHTDSRHLERLHIAADGSLVALFNPDFQQWVIFDHAAREGLLWISDEDMLPSWEQGSPFKTLLNWLLAPSPLFMVHSGAVGTEAGGCLLVGQGGSGKSTTVAACFERGMSVCGDDLILIQPENAGYRAWALYNSLKFDPQSSVQPPRMFLSAPFVMSASKRLVRYTDVRPDGLANNLPIKAIVRCVIAKRPQSQILEESPAAMLKALAPPTVFLLRGNEEAAIRKISKMVRSLPCYRLELGSDPSAAAAFLDSWLALRGEQARPRSSVT